MAKAKIIILLIYNSNLKHNKMGKRGNFFSWMAMPNLPRMVIHRRQEERTIRLKLLSICMAKILPRYLGS